MSVIELIVFRLPIHLKIKLIRRSISCPNVLYILLKYFHNLLNKLLKYSYQNII